MARTPSADYLILDIETVPDSERWVRPELPHGESAFPPTWAHRIIVVGYLWWKTRALRRQAHAFGDDGRTVDVEIVHKDSPDNDSAKR